MIDIAYKLEKCYDKAQQIGGRNRWYANFPFLIILLFGVGILSYIIIPKDTKSLCAVAYVIALLLPYIVYLVYITKKESKIKFKKLGIPFGEKIKRSESFSNFKIKKIESFRNELRSNGLLSSKNLNTNLSVYKKLADNESKRLHKEPKPIIGISLFVGFIIGIISDMIKPFFSELMKTYTDLSIALIILIVYLGCYILFIFSNIRETYFRYLNKRSSKFKEISEWLEVISANQLL